MEFDFISKDIEQALRHTTFLLPNWKWILLATTIALTVLLKPLAQIIFRKLKTWVPAKWSQKKTFSYYLLQLHVEQPLAWIITMVFWQFSLDTLKLSANADKYLNYVIHGIAGYYIIKLVYLGVTAFGRILTDKVAKTESTLDDQLAPFATKTLKVLVVVLGTLILLQGFGLNVMSLLAGLGLGGLALALAAQDTAANVFGSITILMDQPFKVGDHVKIQDIEGTVEEIGFRSTRIRTFYSSLVAIPNATIAKEKIDNLGVRPVRRIRHNLGIHYDTPTKTIEEFCDSLRYLITQHDKVVKESVTVALNGCGDSALNILVNFNIHVFVATEENEIQQKFLLEALDLGRKMNVDFAYPTRNVYLHTMKNASVAADA